MKRKAAMVLCAVTIALYVAGCSAGETAGAAPEQADGANVGEPAPQSGESASAAEPAPDEIPAAGTAGEPLPGSGWEFDAPENHGMDGAVLDALHAALAGTQVYSAVTVKDGYIVDEFYREGYDENSIFQLNSCSKSFTSALVGIAIDEGLIEGVDVPIAEYFPQLAGTDKEGITIRHVLEHTAGFEWYEFGGDGRSFWQLNSADNWVDYVLERPMVAAPGTTFNYTTGGSHLLAAILEQVTDVPLLAYAQEHIFTPLGMDSVQWRADPQQVLDGGNGIEMTTRDAAKFGQLFLQGGSWADRQLVPAQWVEQSTGVQVARSGNYGSYGYQWWIRPFAGYDTFYAMGAFGQFILVVPELDLVAAITSDRSGGTDAPYTYISNYILAACDAG